MPVCLCVCAHVCVHLPHVCAACGEECIRYPVAELCTAVSHPTWTLEFRVSGRTAGAHGRGALLQPFPVLWMSSCVCMSPEEDQFSKAGVSSDSELLWVLGVEVWPSVWATSAPYTRFFFPFP